MRRPPRAGRGPPTCPSSCCCRWTCAAPGADAGPRALDLPRRRRARGPGGRQRARRGAADVARALPARRTAAPAPVRRRAAGAPWCWPSPTPPAPTWRATWACRAERIATTPLAADASFVPTETRAGHPGPLPAVRGRAGQPRLAQEPGRPARGLRALAARGRPARDAGAGRRDGARGRAPGAARARAGRAGGLPRLRGRRRPARAVQRGHLLRDRQPLRGVRPAGAGGHLLRDAGGRLRRRRRSRGGRAGGAAGSRRGPDRAVSRA